MPRATARRATSSCSTRCAGSSIDWDEGVDVGGPHAPYRQSQRTDIYLEVIEKLKATGHLYESFSTRRGDRRPQRRRRSRPQAGLRQLRPRPHRRAARGVPRRGPRARAAPARARQRPHLRRPRPRRDHLPGRLVHRLRGRAPRRRAALHLRQPGRRRAHGHHARAARRGPAVVAPRARSRSTARSSRSASRPSCPRFGHLPLRDGRGQQEALQARPGVEPVPAPRPRLHPRGPAQLPLPARLVALRTTATSSRSTRWSRRSTSSTSTRTRPASTRRRPSRSTATTSACSRSTDFAARLVPYLGDLVVDRRRPRACCSRPRRSCRSACSCSARRRDCSRSSSRRRRDLEVDADALPGAEGADRARRGDPRPRGRSTRGPHEAIEEALRSRAHRRARAQAAHRLRPAAHRDLRSPREPAAVRVDGAARQGVEPRSPRSPSGPTVGFRQGESVDTDAFMT